MQEKELETQNTPDVGEGSALPDNPTVGEGSTLPESLTVGEGSTLTESPPENTTYHLSGALPRSAGVPSGVMSKSDLRELRQLFSNLSDAEIQRLYKTVTK